MKGNNDGAHGERTKEKPKRYGGSKKKMGRQGDATCVAGVERDADEHNERVRVCATDQYG